MDQALEISFTESESKKEWKYELVARHGRSIVVIYYDNVVRGNVTLYTQEEVRYWQKLITKVNEDGTKDSLSKTDGESRSGGSIT